MRFAVALIAAIALVPAGIRADDWEENYPGGSSDDRSAYDVSVDLNVSGGVTFESFQGPLSPYGDWVVVGNYGRVWRPRVAAGWRPYYYGRWEWTNEGWLWASDEPYGWAVYHYGRWAHDPYYGWIWVPGYDWAPAWVSWRTSGDAVGWAPLAPGLSVYVTAYPFIDFWWTFVPTARFASVPVYSVAYAPSYTRQWYQRTAPAPARPAPAPGMRSAPTPAWGGPGPRLVSERMGRPLTPVRVVPAQAPGARGRPGEIPVYRPGQPGGRGRGPEAVAAPGRGGDRAYAPPPRGSGAGPGPAPERGWSRGDRGGPPGWRSEPRRESAPAQPPPAYRPEGRREIPQPSPAYRPEVRREPPQQTPAYRPEPRREAAPAPQPQRRDGGDDRGPRWR